MESIKNMELVRKTPSYASRALHNIFNDLERLRLCICYQNLHQQWPRSMRVRNHLGHICDAA